MCHVPQPYSLEPVRVNVLIIVNFVGVGDVALFYGILMLSYCIRKHAHSYIISLIINSCDILSVIDIRCV